MAHLHGADLLSRGALRWMTLLTTSLHTVINPVIVIANAACR